MTHNPAIVQYPGQAPILSLFYISVWHVQLVGPLTFYLFTQTLLGCVLARWRLLWPVRRHQRFAAACKA